MRNKLLLMLLVSAIFALGFGQNVVAGTVAGQVVDADGDPVVRATVSIMQQVDHRGAHNARAVTNERGVFEFADVPAGNYVIAAVRGDAGVRDQFSIREDGAVRIRLQFAGDGGGRGGDDDRGDREIGAVIATVYTPNRNLVPGAVVYLRPLERGLRAVRGHTDRQGQVVFPRVLAGRYAAYALVRGGRGIARLEVTADQRNQVRLVLERFQRDDRRGDRGDGAPIMAAPRDLEAF